MAGGAKKSTKRFQKNHLKDTLDRRNQNAKVKQRQRLKEKKKGRNTASAPQDDSAGTRINGKPVPSDVAQELSKMSVDEFFQGGFELPEKLKSKGRSDKKATGKRKRGSDDANDSSDRDEEQIESDSAAGSDLGAHKDDLEALAEKDPEFYQYLKENDAELLDFQGDDLEDLDESEADDEPVDEETQPARQESTITKAMIKKWRTAMTEEHSLSSMRQAVLAFRAAAFLNSEEQAVQKYTIPSPEIYHEVLVTTLESVPLVLNHHLPVKQRGNKSQIATDSKKFRNLTPFFKSYTASILQLLATLSDAPTIKLTLSGVTSILPYLLSFKKLLKLLIKSVVAIYSTTASPDAATLVTAFLLLRRLFVISDPTIREAILKQTYQGLVQSARTTNSHTLPTINLIKNSSVDLWSLDADLSYTVGFVSIRQLAVHLRSSITHPTKDSYKAIYNWQYVHSLDFFSRILSTACSPMTTPTLKKPSDSPLHPLIYPLVQITLGALRLIPTSIYYPLRFHLTRALLRISRTTETYIPLAPSLIELLQSAEMSKPPKASTLPPLDSNTIIRAPKSYLRTRVYQDGLGAQIQELLADFFGCWAKNIAFPELCLPPSVMLKRWLKSVSGTSTHKSGAYPAAGMNNTNKNGRKQQQQSGGNKNSKLNSQIALLVHKMAANAAFIEGHRKHVSFGPGNREEVDRFLREVQLDDTPMGAFAKGLREQREQRERVVEKGRETKEARAGKVEKLGRKKENGVSKGARGGERVEAPESGDDSDIEIEDEGGE